jgi:hypothetical protein
MKTLTCTVLAAGCLALASEVQAQYIIGAHYPAGVEGIKGASLPPPGFYVRDYNLFYTADRFEKVSKDFDIFAYVNAPRFIWMTDHKILGANYGMDVLATVGHADWNAAGDDDYFGIGDIQIEPLLLSWQCKQFDISAGYAFWAPIGDFDVKRPSLIAKGFWSHQLTLGSTWHIDEARTWAFSLLNRYEFCHEQQNTDIDPGQVYTAEWGLSKTVCANVDAGLVGYYQQQTTYDKGAPTAMGHHDRVFGLGPEVSTFCPKLGLFASLRYIHEFGARYRPEGHLVSLTLTKPL